MDGENTAYIFIYNHKKKLLADIATGFDQNPSSFITKQAYFSADEKHVFLHITLCGHQGKNEYKEFVRVFAFTPEKNGVLNRAERIADLLPINSEQLKTLHNQDLTYDETTKKLVALSSETALVNTNT